MSIADQLRAEGRVEGIKRVALKMLDKGLSANMITEFTGLPLESILDLLNGNAQLTEDGP